MQDITREDLLKRYAAGERDFQGVILQYISLDGVELEGVDFTGAIFNSVTFESVWIDNCISNCGFINCNFSCSEWWFCRIPEMSGCNLQYAVMEACYFRGSSVDCDWRSSHTIEAYHDEFIFERCDLRESRESTGRYHLGPEPYGHPGFGILYRDTLDRDGVFHSGIDCTLRTRPDPNDPIPF